MSPRVLVIGGLSVVVCALLVWCGCGARPSFARYERPIGSDDVEAGRRRYQVVCAPCHERRGERNAPSLEALGWSPGRVRRQVREGSVLMPPIRPSRLSDGELEDLLAYFADIGAVIEEESDEERRGVAWVSAMRDAGVDAPIDRDAARVSTGVSDAGTRAVEDDVGSSDATAIAASSDAGPSDAADAGPSDAADAGPSDAGERGPIDAGSIDAGSIDAGSTDAGSRAYAPDGSVPDAGSPDAGGPGGGRADAGVVPSGRALADPAWRR